MPGAYSYNKVRAAVAVQVYLPPHSLMPAWHGVAPTAALVLVAPGSLGRAGQITDCLKTLSLAIPNGKHPVNICAKGVAGNIFDTVTVPVSFREQR